MFHSTTTENTKQLTDGPILISTGLDMFDSVMGGGSPAGEVNALLGPMDSCATLLGTQMLASAAATTAAQVKESGVPRRHVYINYAARRDVMRRNAISCAARIPERRLYEIAGGRAQYSCSGQLKPYEVERFGAESPGGFERNKACLDYLERYTAFPDFSGGMADGVRLGFGGVDELAAVLHDIRREAGMDLGLVIIDGVLMGCLRELDTRQVENNRALTSSLAAYVDRVRGQIAVPLNCAVWVIHYLRRPIRQTPPTSVPHHREAAWCRKFAASAGFAFCLGNQDPSTSTCLLGATNPRTGEVYPPTRCRIEGDFRRIVADTGYASDLIPRITGLGTATARAPEQTLPAPGIRKHRKSKSKFRSEAKLEPKLKDLPSPVEPRLVPDECASTSNLAPMAGMVTVGAGGGTDR